MLKKLAFSEAHGLWILNQGKREWNGLIAWAALVVVTLLWFIPQQHNRIPLPILAGFGPFFFGIAIKLSIDEIRRVKTLRQFKEKVRVMESVFELGDTSGQRDDEVVGAIRRHLINSASAILSCENEAEELGKRCVNESSTQRELLIGRIKALGWEAKSKRRIMSEALDLAKECFGDRIDSGHGLASFFRWGKRG